ncbi:hypothetical protein LTR94_024044 [Friedmanniomyces endolithicus]|nr:hypothetical protein LTR94_024044 [Friedmanniomyces endolithicus]
MEPYLLRVADRGRLALVPETEHLAPIVQMSVGDDRARGLDELPMPEHIDQRSGRHGGEAGKRRLAAPEQIGEALRPLPVAIIRIGLAPIAFEVRHPLGAARAVPARRLQIDFDRDAGEARDRRRGRLPGAGIGRRDDERGRLRPARRDLARLFVAVLRQLDRREIATRHAGVACRFAVADEDRPHMRHLSEYLAMRAKAREAQRFVVGLGVDQHQIGLDVAIAVARPIAAQIMVAVFGIKRRVGRERGQDGQKIGIEGRSMSAL